MENLKQVILTNTKGKSNKFYNLTLVRDDKGHLVLYRHWGKIGFPGRHQESRFFSENEAQRVFDHILKSKLDKGYVSVKAPVHKKKVAKKKIPKKEKSLLKPWAVEAWDVL